MGTLVLGLGTAAVALTGGFAAACLRLRSTVSFLLAAYLLASAEIVASSLALSIGRWLDRGTLLAVIVALLGIAALVWLRLGRPRPPHPTDPLGAMRRVIADPLLSALAALAVLTHAYILASALTVPQGAGDALLYHLPRAALWKQQHAVAYVANAPDERINAFPPNAEIESLATMILSGGDRYVSIGQLLALVFACVAIVGVSTRLGLGLSAAMFGALAFSTFTVVVLQAPTALNDLVVASLLISCAYFAMSTSRLELGLAALALALALGTKLTAVFALPALALFAFSSQPSRRWPSLALVGATGTVAGSLWLMVNVIQTGRLDADVVLDRGREPLERIRLSLADLFELSDAEGKGLLLPPLFGGGAFALALVVAAVLAARKNVRASVVAVAVGVVAFFALPMLSIWAQVAQRAFDQVRATVGLIAAAPGPRVPGELYESAMHSSYGIAFVVLLLGAGGLAVVEVARGTLSVNALVALGGVPLTLVIVALALAYDPQHMRYIAFPVALASAVFGVALRARVLAWTSVALITATLTVTLGYFAPRPAGLALLPENRSTDRNARWVIQAESGGPSADLDAFRYLQTEIPPNATLALWAERDTYLYPAWDAHLRRTVLFPADIWSVPEAADWLVVGPRKGVDAARLALAGWRLELASGGGWRVFRR